MTNQHIHFLGICGTFMGSLAVLARQQGYKVTGSDQAVYPPMSTYLESLGIEIIQGYEVEQLNTKPDIVIIGNAMKRGMPVVERVLDEGMNYFSGPEWLYQSILKHKHVIAISGTHGKSTTTTLMVKILEEAGLTPSFLIGGISQDLGVSSRLTDSPYFVIEADEYDTAFFDKRSKFVHYHPTTLLINNIEFDHADIFNSVEDIYRQFHHMIRAIPSKANIIYPSQDQHIAKVLEMGCWSNQIAMSSPYPKITPISADYRSFVIHESDTVSTQVQWSMMGEHNAQNALSAYTIARSLGIDASVIAKAMTTFKGIKRRLECLYEDQFSRLYDDFAHHPTAIKHTLQTLKAQDASREVIALVDPRSNTMKMGVHNHELKEALAYADKVWLFAHPNLKWDAQSLFADSANVALFSDVADIHHTLIQHHAQQIPSTYVIMSNGGFDGLSKILVNSLG